MIIATCPNYNFQNNTCDQVVFVEQMGLLPPLSISDASSLASLVILCWVTGYSFKLVRKYIFK